MGTSGPGAAHLGRYELVARLASGGMGEIFLARLEGAAGFEKLCVIKRILPHLADDPRFRAMLIGEARIASMMTHSNVCQVHELGETDGQLYIVMEYLEGITILPLLRKLSKEAGQLDLGFVSSVIQQASDGLHYAHELKARSGELLGIVHRDVTPSNLFITESGVVKVLDFGIAKVKDASAHTQTGTVKGKYAYMAPEQLRGAAVDRRADVFALGVAAYELLALRRLFQRKTDYLTFRAVMEQPIMDIRHYRPDCPDALAVALARALDRDPDHRFATARELGTAVQDAIAPVRRPWTHGQIGDFVCASFAEDIQKRGQQIASAVRTSLAPEAMPLIVQPDEETEIDDGTEEFPPVDSAVSGTPVDARHIHGATPEQGFSEPSTTGPALEELRAVPGTQPQPVVVVEHRRSVIWPLVAISMVVIAAGALFLVWKQTQHPQQTVVIEGPGVHKRDSNTLVVEPSNEPPAADPEIAPLVAPGSDDPGAAPRPRPGPDPFNAAVKRKKPEVDRCVTTHGNPPPGTRVVLVVGRDGHTKTITLDPRTVDATPLGSCIRSVFEATLFPHGDGDREIVVKLRVAANAPA
ncbi:MAG: serine/threonine-protein kinase [Kofleriaceae bacterium]